MVLAGGGGRGGAVAFSLLGSRRGRAAAACSRPRAMLAGGPWRRAKWGGGQQRLFCFHRSACARPRWQGVGGSALAGESAATLGRRRLRVSGYFAGWCWGGGVSGVVLMGRRRWRIGVGRGAVTVLAPARWCRRGRDPAINKRWKVEGGSGGRQASHGVGGGLIVIIKLSNFNHE